MKCNPWECKHRVFRNSKKRHWDVYDINSNIPQCSGLTVLGLNFQQDCRYDKHGKDKLAEAHKCLNVIRFLRKEGRSQFGVNYFFKTIVLPSVTYSLVVYGASEPEIETVQDFLDRHQKGRYISVRWNVRALLEKQDRYSMLPSIQTLPRPSFIRLPHFFPAHLHILQSCYSFNFGMWTWGVLNFCQVNDKKEDPELSS